MQERDFRAEFKKELENPSPVYTDEKDGMFFAGQGIRNLLILNPKEAALLYHHLGEYLQKKQEQRR